MGIGIIGSPHHTKPTKPPIDCKTFFSFTKEVFNAFPFLANTCHNKGYEVVDNVDFIKIRCKNHRSWEKLQGFLKATKRLRHIIDNPSKQQQKTKRKELKAIDQANASLVNGINILNSMIDQTNSLIINKDSPNEAQIIKPATTQHNLIPACQSKLLDTIYHSPFAAVKSNNFDALNEELDEMLSNCEAKPKLYIRQTRTNFLTHALGIKYETFVAEHYRLKGYLVETTPKVHDYGVDLLAIKNEEIIAIQCKYWENYAGIDSVQQIFSGAVYYNANQAIAITNNGFTTNAKHLAEKIGVSLIILPLKY